jgi:hypothetical protein
MITAAEDGTRPRQPHGLSPSYRNVAPLKSGRRRAARRRCSRPNVLRARVRAANLDERVSHAGFQARIGVGASDPRRACDSPAFGNELMADRHGARESLAAMGI